MVRNHHVNLDEINLLSEFRRTGALTPLQIVLVNATRHVGLPEDGQMGMAANAILAQLFEVDWLNATPPVADHIAAILLTAGFDVNNPGTELLPQLINWEDLTPVEAALASTVRHNENLSALGQVEMASFRLFLGIPLNGNVNPTQAQINHANQLESQGRNVDMIRRMWDAAAEARAR